MAAFFSSGVVVLFFSCGLATPLFPRGVVSSDTGGVALLIFFLGVVLLGGVCSDRLGGACSDRLGGVCCDLLGGVCIDLLGGVCVLGCLIGEMLESHFSMSIFSFLAGRSES